LNIETENSSKMEDKLVEIRNNFNENFKAKDYYKKLHKELLVAEDMFVFNLRFLHDVLESGRFKGSKMLELGSAATVHNIASASAHFPNIIQSDLVEENREQLKKWLRGHTEFFDWSHFLDLVAKIESPDSDPKNIRPSLETRIRNSVKGVIKGDVLNDYIVAIDEKKYSDVSPPYDLVSSFWCLENAAPDFDTYVAVLKKINRILKIGGGIIIGGFENGGTMYIGEKPFPYLKLSLNDVTNALNMAGFVNHDIKIQKKLDNDFGYEYENIFCVAAEKEA